MLWNLRSLSLANPYLQLIRFHAPIGVFLLMAPCWWSLALTGEDENKWVLYLIFALGAFLMRSGGCIINDLCDRHLDSQVERTKSRPLASGAIRPRHAVYFLFFLLLCAAGLLFFLPLVVTYLALIILPLIVIYPLMKRFTYWPQAFLALTFNWGVLMAWVSVEESLNIVPLLLYGAGFLWTIGYDSIYAHQDKKDDINIGVKSTALLWQGQTKKWVAMMYMVMIALLWMVGVVVGATATYYIGIIIAAICLLWQAMTVNLDNRRDCKMKFKSNQFIGLIIFMSAIAA